MLNNALIKEHLLKEKDVDWVEVKGDGYHYQLTIVADVFKEKSKVARQQWVYKILKDYIASGDLHALTMQTWTREEWEKKHG